MESGISGKVALVTGGSMGIGKATAMALASQGAKIAICARNMDRLKQAAREIQDETGWKSSEQILERYFAEDLE